MAKKKVGAPKRELAFYYPNPIWYHGDWVKSLILFFDGIALLVPDYIKRRPEEVDPAIVAGLKKHGLLEIISPEKAVDKAATQQLVSAMEQVLGSGRLASLQKDKKTAFHGLSMSRLGFYGDEALATKLVAELRKLGLAKGTTDGLSIELHPAVRSLVLVLLSQILRPYGDTINAELSPATDMPQLVDALGELVALDNTPSVGSVVAFDLSAVTVDLGPVPIDEVLDYRKQNLTAHRKYCVSARNFAAQLSRMSANERKTAFEQRQLELDEIAADLRARARKAWKKPVSFALSLTGAAVSVAAGNPWGAVLSAGSALLGYQSSAKPVTGAYSYLFKAQGRFS